MIRFGTASRSTQPTRSRFKHLLRPCLRRAINMTFFMAALALLLHLVPGGIKPTRAQSSRKDDTLFNSRGTPRAGATMRVCSMPTSGQPCTPLAQIYSDSALTQALANPIATDGLGNYFFYAAPGKYMIEISGPGIITKQIPNVILPSDPTNPSFSGVISAFSLNLTGNLTVNGSASVIGNLASGTLNLSNQAAPPVSASAGTVNLYTKATDKKPYYIDETGTETGPLGVGGGGASPAGNNGDLQSKSGPALQASRVNDNGATLAIDRDQQSAGPNPHFDIRAFGGYISAATNTMTCSINAGSITLTCTSNPDFKDANGIPGSSLGHGVVVPGAGVTPTITPPGRPTVTPNLLNGSTTWNYRVAAEDYKGGLTAATATGTTTSGSSALGVATFTITTATRTSGVTTYTTSSPHNLQRGMTVLICQFGGGACPGTFIDGFNGTKVVQSTPSSTTFTTYDGNVGDASESPAAGQGQVLACNTLTFPASSYGGSGTLRYWVYRSRGAGAYSLVGVALGLDPYFQDCGGAAPNVPGYVPSAPPAAARAGYLASTISSGGGTNTLTLANAAATTVTNVTVSHDNSIALLTAVQAAANQTGATVYIPSFPNNGSRAVFWPFNALTNFGTISSINNAYPSILINGHIALSQPWVLRSNMKVEGMPKKNSSFMYVPGAWIAGTANPMFYWVTSSSVVLRNMFIGTQGTQATGVYADEDTGGGGSAGIILENVGVAGQSANGYSRNIVIKGGFNYYFRQFTCDLGGPTIFLPRPCVDITNSSSAVTGSNNGQVPGRVAFDFAYFIGTGVSINNFPNATTGGTSGFRFTAILSESAYPPFLRVGGRGYVDDVLLSDVVVADQIAGSGTPLIDSSTISSGGGSYSIVGGQLSGGLPPLLINGNSLILSNPPSVNYGNTPWYATARQNVDVNNEPLNVHGTGRVTYTMTPPAALSSCTVSAGGSVPVGTFSYALTAVDYDNTETLLGLPVSVTTTLGNQTVTCNLPALPLGAKGFNGYRNGARFSGGTCSSPQMVSGTLVDVHAVGCGNSPPNYSSAGSSILSGSGLSTYQLRLNGSPLTGTTGSGTIAATSRGSNGQGHLPTFDASGNLVDAGIAPTNVTDYFNRAAGNLGSEANSPWTIVAGTLLVTAGGVGGNTSGQNYAVFTGVGFPNDDQTVSATWVKSGTPSTQANALVLRGSPAALTSYTCQPANNGSSLTIAKFVSGSFTSLATQSATINTGDTISFNITGTSLNCYVNGTPVVAATDSSINSGFPGLGGFQLYNANGANLQWKNWMASPGYVSLQRPQTWSQLQTFMPGIALGSETISASPRGFLNAFLSGALSSTWTGSTVTLDKAITITRVQVQAKTAPSGCATNAIVRLTDGTTPVNVTISGAANDSGAIAQNYPAGASLTISVQTAASGCTTVPADVNAIIQYKMQ